MKEKAEIIHLHDQWCCSSISSCFSLFSFKFFLQANSMRVFKPHLKKHQNITCHRTKWAAGVPLTVMKYVPWNTSSVTSRDKPAHCIKHEHRLRAFAKFCLFFSTENKTNLPRSLPHNHNTNAIFKNQHFNHDKWGNGTYECAVFK